VAERKVGIRVSAEGAKTAAAEIKKIQQSLAGLSKPTGLKDLSTSAAVANTALADTEAAAVRVGVAVGNIGGEDFAQIAEEASGATAAEQALAGSVQNASAGLATTRAAGADAGEAINAGAKKGKEGYVSLGVALDQIKARIRKATQETGVSTKQVLDAITAQAKADATRVAEAVLAAQAGVKGAAQKKKPRRPMGFGAISAQRKADIEAEANAEADTKIDAEAAAAAKVEAARRAQERQLLAARKKQKPALPSSTKQLTDLGAAAKKTAPEIQNVTDGIGGLNAIAAVIDPRLGQAASVLGAVRIAGDGAATAFSSLTKSLKATAAALLNPTFLLAAALIGALIVLYKRWTASTEAQRKAQEEQTKALQKTLDLRKKIDDAAKKAATSKQQALQEAGRAPTEDNIKDLTVKAASVALATGVSQAEAEKRLLGQSPAGGPLQVNKTVEALGLQSLKAQKVQTQVTQARARGVPEAELKKLRSDLESQDILTGNKAVDDATRQEARDLLREFNKGPAFQARLQTFRKTTREAFSHSRLGIAREKEIQDSLKEEQSKLRFNATDANKVAISENAPFFPSLAEHTRGLDINQQLDVSEERLKKARNLQEQQKAAASLVVNNSIVFLGPKAIGANTPTPPGQVVIP